MIILQFLRFVTIDIYSKTGVDGERLGLHEGPGNNEVEDALGTDVGDGSVPVERPLEGIDPPHLPPRARPSSSAFLPVRHRQLEASVLGAHPQRHVLRSGSFSVHEHLLAMVLHY